MRNINNRVLKFFWLCIGLNFLFLIFRNTGLYPTVFSDEYTYSKLSRLIPMSDSPIPIYAYLKLFNTTNYCGDGFLECAKIINAFVFVAAAPFIYWISRRVADQRVSVYVSLLAIMGPISSYTAYFKPESLYFLSFWVFCWYLLTLGSQSGKWCWFLGGVLFAVSSLVKPHTILFLPAVFIYVIFLFIQEQRSLSKRTVFVMLYFLIGALMTKMSLSYFFAGSAGLTIFGSDYGEHARSTVLETQNYVQLLLLTGESLTGHAVVSALLYGLPLVLAISTTIKILLPKIYKPIDDENQTSQYQKITFFSLIIILNLIFVTAIFTASVANAGPYESSYRLHMRYYNFALPLLYVVAGGALNINAKSLAPTRWIVGGFFILMAGYAIHTNLAPYTLGYVDSPEIWGLHIDEFYFKSIGSLLLLVLVIFLINQRKGLQLYLYLALPLFLIISLYQVDREQSGRLIPDTYDKAGMFTKHYLPNTDMSKLIVVGSKLGELYRTLYYLDSPVASFELINKDSIYDLRKRPDNKDWVLVIGDHKVVGTSQFQINLNGFSLIKADED